MDTKFLKHFSHLFLAWEIYTVCVLCQDITSNNPGTTNIGTDLTTDSDATVTMESVSGDTVTIQQGTRSSVEMTVNSMDPITGDMLSGMTTMEPLTGTVTSELTSSNLDFSTLLAQITPGTTSTVEELTSVGPGMSSLGISIEPDGTTQSNKISSSQTDSNTNPLNTDDTTAEPQTQTSSVLESSVMPTEETSSLLSLGSLNPETPTVSVITSSTLETNTFKIETKPIPTLVTKSLSSAETTNMISGASTDSVMTSNTFEMFTSEATIISSKRDIGSMQTQLTTSNSQAIQTTLQPQITNTDFELSSLKSVSPMDIITDVSVLDASSANPASGATDSAVTSSGLDSTSMTKEVVTAITLSEVTGGLTMQPGLTSKQPDIDQTTVDGFAGTPVVEPGVSRDPGIIVVPGVPDGSQSCERGTNNACNVSNLERCVLIRERAARCVCLSGYARGGDGKSCIAVEQYMGSLKTKEIFTNELADKNSDTYRQLEYNARETLIKSIGNSNLQSIANNVVVVGFRKAIDGTVIADYKLEISREYAPTVEMVRMELMEGVMKTVDNNENLVMLILSPETLTATDPDPCSDPLLNHCDSTATCQRSRRGFICQCQQGDTDISLNRIEAPGEICTAASCPCENGGQCIKNTDGISCICPEWFLGENCSIDGKAILIGVACAMGFAMAITIFTLTYYCFRVPAYPKIPQSIIGTRRVTHSQAAKIVQLYRRKFSSREYIRQYYSPSNYFYYYNEPLNYWQPPTTELYSPRYTPRYAPGSLTWNWTER